ncbi:MAG TPA: SusE domain-containing protein [Cyclobacteriaceae bacterium]|nr:SusE domain-containing protein [Cyclobacteriaceae bacterium]
MKKLINISIIGLLVICWSCKPDEDVIDLGTQPAPNALTNETPATGTMTLKQEDAGDTFAILSWSAADFGGRTVNYSVELDKAGKNFASARDIITVKRLKDTLTVSDINAALIDYGIKPGEATAIEIRIRSWVDYISFPATSNVLAFTLTPYELVFPPLYVNGDAQGWNWSNAVALTSTTPGVYTGKAKFQTNGKFRFFKIPDWSIAGNEFGFSSFPVASLPAEFVTGNDGDNNIQFTGLTADYNVTVSLAANTITIALAGPPPPPTALYLVTAQTADLATSLELESIDSAVYQGIYMLDANTKFRVFAGQQWNAAKWGWTFFGDEADELLEDSGDDISNILFNGVAGYYIITVSLVDKSITLEATDAPAQVLFLVGDPNGWALNDLLAMRSLGGNTFEVIAQFDQGDIFRFFKELDWSGDQVRYSSFAGGTIDTELADGGGGDSNIRFAAASGIYKMTVSLSDKTIVVVPASAPKLYIMGDDQSWTPANSVSMTWLGGGKFEATTTFTNNAIFRFFADNNPANWDWNAPQWRYSSFADGTIDSDLGDGGGGDSNFRFVGTTGSHTLTVNVNSLLVELN